MQFGNRTKDKEIVKSKSSPGLFGGSVIRHYDKNGHEIAKSYSHTGLFGEEVIKHYDSSGKEIGKSYTYDGILGGKVSRHYDNKHNEIGKSHTYDGIFGTETTSYTDKKGNKSKSHSIHTFSGKTTSKAGSTTGCSVLLFSIILLILGLSTTIFIPN